MDSVLERMVKEDCLEGAALHRGLNGAREQLSCIFRRAFQAKEAPSAKKPVAKEKG